MSSFALLAKATEQINANPQVAFQALLVEFDREGPYPVAKKYGCLVDNNAVDFAIEVMTIANVDEPNRY